MAIPANIGYLRPYLSDSGPQTGGPTVYPYIFVTHQKNYVWTFVLPVGTG